MKKILFTFCIFFMCLFIVNAKEAATLKRCVDGDTARFIINDEEKAVRFLAIDTKETVHPYKEVEKYGKDASEYTCNKLTNAKKIELEYDPNSTKEDKYNRVLAWVFVDDKLLQESLVEIGYAEVKYLYGDYKYTKALQEKEQYAKREQLGIWASEDSKNNANNIFIVIGAFSFLIILEVMRRKLKISKTKMNKIINKIKK